MTSSLLTGAVIADHIAKSFGDGTLPEFLTKYDVNEDGSIDEEERQAIKDFILTLLEFCCHMIVTFNG